MTKPGHMPTETPPQRQVLHHVLASRQVDQGGISGLLDCVTTDDGRVIVFLGHGTAADAVSASPGVLPRAVGRSLMVVLADPAQPSLPTVEGGRVDLHPTPAQTDLFAGLNCQIAQRFDETARQVADGLLWHHRAHGLQGAVIVNRAPDGGADLADQLRVALAGCDLRVVVLDCPLPLGQHDGVAETHLLLAPDASGKDRMARPDPDPWRAPLVESLLYEVIKWRYLARARAVLALDVCDILAPGGVGLPSAFDLCVDAEHGVTLLIGRRIYPWRVREGVAARFGDHICQMFDRRRGFARWGVAPEKAGLDNVWRSVRVSYAKPDPGLTVPFFRAMAIRVPEQASAALAPKTALIEQPDLIALSQTEFGWKPVRAPVSKARNAPRAARDAGRTVIITTMKNEGPFILDWLAYHRAIGVDDFLIYTNDCTDGTDTLLDLLQGHGIVQHRANPFRQTDLKPQHAALQAAESEPVVLSCGWGICMDVDEYINIKVGDGTLPALFDAMGDANMISLTWRLFGNGGVNGGGVQGFADVPVCEQFTRCAPEVIRKPHQAWGFKTLFRNLDIYKKLGVHRPKGLRPDLWTEVRWLNGSGRPLPVDMLRNGWRSSMDTYGYDWVQLNHYAVRSAESFLVKRDRGRVNHVDRDQGLNYWFRMNHNADQDRTILRMMPLVAAERARLMAEPGVAALHDRAVAHHRAKIAELRDTETHARFYDELTSPRMERLCQMQAHFGSAVFAAGPHVVPDEVLARDLPPGFFFTIPAPDGTSP